MTRTSSLRIVLLSSFSCLSIAACSETGDGGMSDLGASSAPTSSFVAPMGAGPGPAGNQTAEGVATPMPSTASTPGSSVPGPAAQGSSNGGAPGEVNEPSNGGTPPVVPPAAEPDPSDPVGGAGAESASGGAGASGLGGESGLGGAPGGAGDPAAAGTASGGDTGTAGMSGGNTSPCDGAGMLMAGDSEHSLTVGDYTYPFNVHTPPGYDGVTRMSVVFDFHGLGGNEDQMIRLSGWASAGDAHGFITVFPGGPDNGWNAGGCCTDTPTDLEFVREAIAYLDGQGCIDTKRVYASGCSNGGAMSYRLACEAADIIAAVAPVDFDCVAGNGFGCDCEPERPITEIQFRGTNDTAVNYGEENSGARGNFATWGEINMCTGAPETLPENDSCQRHTECADGVESILCTVQNGSHCGSYMSFGIAELAWEIISRYSLP